MATAINLVVNPLRSQRSAFVFRIFVFRTFLAFLAGQLSAGSLAAQDRWSQDSSRSRDGSFSSAFRQNDWISSASNSHQWNLGVQGESTEVGFLIRQVTTGGAASRARMQTGDSIIAVEGFQVGFVGERLYELNDELNQRANAGGVVRLLLQDGQTGRLASVRVQLDRQVQRLTGTIQATSLLPPDAVVHVQIENLTRPQWVVRNGHQVISAPNQRTIPFDIAYDPAYISASDIYQVRAFVSSGGRNILFTPQPVRVLTLGNPSQVQLRLEPIATGGSTPVGTSGTLTGFPNYNQIDEEVTRIYRLYLGRSPSPAELAAAHILSTDLRTLSERLPLKLMASQEYFDLARNSNDFWLRNVFGVIVGREPSQPEVTQWQRRFAELNYSRTELLRQLHQQSK
jgi:uncharacterized lipoprotein YbaY